MPDKAPPGGEEIWSPFQNEAQWEYLSEFALGIMNEHSYQSLSKQMLDAPKPKDWAKVRFITLFPSSNFYSGRIRALQDLCLHYQMGSQDHRRLQH